MFVFVAYTGARRSEMMRTTIDDFDLENGTVLSQLWTAVTGQATLRGGDVGWNTKFDVTNGAVADLILGQEEQLWLQACWASARKQIVRD
jgi:hypothetical protein